VSVLFLFHLPLHDRNSVRRGSISASMEVVQSSHRPFTGRRVLRLDLPCVSYDKPHLVFTPIFVGVYRCWSAVLRSLSSPSIPFCPFSASTTPDETSASYPMRSLLFPITLVPSLRIWNALRTFPSCPPLCLSMPVLCPRPSSLLFSIELFSDLRMGFSPHPQYGIIHEPPPIIRFFLCLLAGASDPYPIFFSFYETTYTATSAGPRSS